ncbi:uncharacterized protein LOC129921526 [Episyrphus balteatus]|uniref:uncharacterized protein LOC129921526 n=1 Tax=Episyrphus balteatus TaxID=286459 RepID=UPI002486BC9D|nr:uncharacterized protein LOC129921526 [Episyrphus balteatus]
MGVPVLDSDNVIPKYIGASSEQTSQNQEHTFSKQKALKDIIANCKEFRIDCNRNNLRIIGNGNKVRINRNFGNLDIVGNDTRIKIMNNSGVIKYTGNSGRIYLGSESPQQAVDYIGCNGILKVLNAADIRTNGGLFTDCQEKCKSPSTSSFLSSSSSDTESGSNSSKSLPSFNRFSIRNNISLPNLVYSGSCKKSANITNSINFSCSTGNIIIKNAINVAF